MTYQMWLPMSLELQATDGEWISIPINCSGMATGFAFIGNPYYCFGEGHPQYDEHWRHKDGDTVCECSEDDPRAYPVADAYQELHMRWKREREEWAEIDAENEAERAEWDHAYAEELATEQWESTTGQLYQIQEELMGV